MNDDEPRSESFLSPEELAKLPLLTERTGVRVVATTSQADGSCNGCHARGPILQLEIGAVNVRVCYRCWRQVRNDGEHAKNFAVEQEKRLKEEGRK